MKDLVQEILESHDLWGRENIDIGSAFGVYNIEPIFVTQKGKNYEITPSNVDDAFYPVIYDKLNLLERMKVIVWEFSKLAQSEFRGKVKVEFYYQKNGSNMLVRNNRLVSVNICDLVEKNLSAYSKLRNLIDGKDEEIRHFPKRPSYKVLNEIAHEIRHLKQHRSLSFDISTLNHDNMYTYATNTKALSNIMSTKSYEYFINNSTLTDSEKLKKLIMYHKYAGYADFLKFLNDLYFYHYAEIDAQVAGYKYMESVREDHILKFGKSKNARDTYSYVKKAIDTNVFDRLRLFKRFPKIIEYFNKLSLTADLNNNLSFKFNDTLTNTLKTAISSTSETPSVIDNTRNMSDYLKCNDRILRVIDDVIKYMETGYIDKEIDKICFDTVTEYILSTNGRPY